MPKVFAPRVHVLPASASPLAVVLRRGPTRKVASILWDRSTDTFTLGQWMSGRIYERRSDLSPDGKFLIYFAMNMKRPEPTGGSWTAVSRAPYLKAVVLLGKGDGWHGGGLWLDKSTYWLNDGFGHKLIRTDTRVRRDEGYRPELYFGGECLNVYFNRLIRDGWTIGGQEKVAPRHRVVTCDKPLPHGWTLRKLAHAQVGASPGRGCYWDDHRLVRESDGAEISCPDWSWCEWDAPRKRLVRVEGGKLFAAGLTASGLGEAVELQDFGPWQYERVKAPY